MNKKLKNKFYFQFFVYEQTERMQCNCRYSTTHQNNSHRTNSKLCVEWTMKAFASFHRFLHTLFLHTATCNARTHSSKRKMCWEFCRCSCLYSGLKSNNITQQLVRKTRFLVLLALLSHILPGYRMCYVPWPIWYVVETTSVRMVFSVFRFHSLFAFHIDSFVLHKLHPFVVFGKYTVYTQHSIHRLSSQQMYRIGLCWTLVIYFLVDFIIELHAMA